MVEKYLPLAIIESLAVGLAYVAWFSGVLYGGFEAGEDTVGEKLMSAFIILLGIIPLAAAAYILVRMSGKRYWWRVNAGLSILLMGFALLFVIYAFLPGLFG